MKDFIFDNLQEIFGVTIGLACGTIVGAITFAIMVFGFAIIQST